MRPREFAAVLAVTIPCSMIGFFLLIWIASWGLWVFKNLLPWPEGL